MLRQRTEDLDMAVPNVLRRRTPCKINQPHLNTQLNIIKIQRKGSSMLAGRT